VVAVGSRLEDEMTLMTPLGNGFAGQRVIGQFGLQGFRKQAVWRDLAGAASLQFLAVVEHVDGRHRLPAVSPSLMNRIVASGAAETLLQNKW